MGKDPRAIREEIARTRAGMADTVDALAYKSDVKARTKDKVRGITSKPKDAVLSIKNNIMGTVSDHAPDTSTIQDATSATTHAIQQAPGQMMSGARRAGGVIRENPIGLAVGGLAAGFVAGLVLPATKVENEKLGPISDQLKESAKESGQELLDHGKEMAQTAVGAAKDAVQDAAPEHADEFASSSQGKATELQGTVGSGSRF